MGEGRRRRRVGEVVGRHVDGLHRRDGALLRGRDPLLQLAHVGGERRLVAHGRRDAAQERRHLGARLGKAEDVVDEEKHVLALGVAEVLRHGERRQPDARARARRLVHLAVYESRLVEHRGAVGELRVGHLVPEVVALAGPLAHPAEHGVAAVLLGDVVDQLEDDDGLADAGAAEEPDLAALRVGREQVDDLDARLEGVGRGGLIDELRGRSVDREERVRLDRSTLVHRFADHVHDPPEGLRADGNDDAVAGVGDRLAASEAVRRVHGDAANGVLAEMERHLDHEIVLAIVDGRVGGAERR